MKLLVLILLVARVVSGQSPSGRRGIPTIARSANGAVVSIIMSDKDGQPIAQGTGFLVSNDGRIVTNYHVIEHGSSAIVKLPDGAFFVVDGVLAFDKAHDLAVLKAHGKNFHTLTLGNSDLLQIGQEVVAIGNPLSLESTVSNGIISGIRVPVQQSPKNGEGVPAEKLLQITAPISPGSSGGPLFNMEGRVVGITTMRLKGGENLNFAVPINEAKRLLIRLDELARKSGEHRQWSPVAEERPSGTEVLHTKPGPFPDAEETGDSNRGGGEYPEPNTGRSYYQQLYDSRELPQDEYVCFDDNTGSPTFFTFKESGPALTANFYFKGVKLNALEFHWDGQAWIHAEPPVAAEAALGTQKVRRLSIQSGTLRYVEILTTVTGTGSTDVSTGSQSTLVSSGTCQRIPSKP